MQSPTHRFGAACAWAVVGLALGAPLPAAAQPDPLHCIQGEWRGGRVEAFGLVPADATPDRNLSLLARSLTLAIGDARIEVTGGGHDASHAFEATPQGRHRVRLDLEGPAQLPDPLVFEVVDARTLRVNLAPGHLIELTRLAEPSGGLERADCARSKPRPNPAGLIVGDWSYSGWERGNGTPLDDGELELVPPLVGLELSIDRFQLRAALGGALETIRYFALPPSGKSTRVNSEAVIFGGEYGAPTTVTMERSDESSLRVGLEKYPGFFLVLGRSTAAAEPAAEPDAVDEAPAAAVEEESAEPPPDHGDAVELAVPYEALCEDGSERLGDGPPDGREQWCERTLDGGERVKHGWYIRWHPNGIKAEAGRFKDGKEHGFWLRWDENGQKRVQAEFRDGVQHGVLIRWDENGRKQHYLLYRDGEAVVAP